MWTWESDAAAMLHSLLTPELALEVTAFRHWMTRWMVLGLALAGRPVALFLGGQRP